MNPPCQLCGGRGVIRVADVYTNLATKKTDVCWELATIRRCGCQYRETA